jgi:hypothetical protein
VDSDIKVGITAPWVENHYQLISWWEMEQFSAKAYYKLGCLLERVKVQYANARNGGDPSFSGSAADVQLKSGESIGLAEFMSAVDGICKDIGLDYAAHQAGEVWKNAPQMTHRQVVTAIESLDKAIQFEMQRNVFLWIGPSRKELYLQHELFGLQVGANFPSIQFDMVEAGNCYAVGRWTGCVFHLMRVLEVGLSVLGNVFGVSLAHTNWAPAIEQIESKIREIHKDPAWKALPDCKEQQEFYAQAASHFGILKDAWRNYTAHARGKYTEDEAKLILLNVKAFMQKLSQRLSE